MIVDLGPRAVSITADEPTAAFDANVVREVELTPTREQSETRRALVELRRFHGGMAPHALLGGQYVPGGETVVIRVGEGLGGQAFLSRPTRGPKVDPGNPTGLGRSCTRGASANARRRCWDRLDRSGCVRSG